MEQNKKWYQKTPWIIALIIIFFPVGLYLMWKYASWNPKIKWVVSGFFAFIFLINLVTGDNKQGSGDNVSKAVQPTVQVQEEQKQTDSPTPSQHKLDANIRFSDTAFMITNNEDKGWTNCRLELNAGIIRGGYTFTTNGIPSKDPLVVPFREFTKGDGTRFNANDTKPQSLSISCDVGTEHGFSYFGIN
jgi:hypothetical protein